MPKFTKIKNRFKNIDWANHFVNFIVVLLSITIAFWLEGVRTENQNKKIEQKALQGILIDLEEDIEVLDSLVIEHKQIITFCEEIRENPKAYQKLNKNIKKDSVLLGKVRTIAFRDLLFTPTSATYESMSNSGRLDVLTDLQLRKKIINLHTKTYREIWASKQSNEREWQDLLKGFNQVVMYKKPYFIIDLDKLIPFIEFNKYLTENQKDYYIRINKECKNLKRKILDATN